MNRRGYVPRYDALMRQRVTTILLLLAGGAIVNVAVALGVFVLVVKPPVPLAFGFFGNAEPDAQAIKLWQSHSVDGWPESALAGVWTHRVWYDEQSWYHQGWGTIRYSPTTPISKLREMFEGIGQYAVMRVRCGFPMRTLQWDSWSGAPKAPPGVLTPNLGNDGLVIGTVILPQSPIWPGFAINTIFYAAILWALFFVPGKVKRTLRRRRGLCPACAYPVGTSNVCTECGAAVTPRLLPP